MVKEHFVKEYENTSSDTHQNGFALDMTQIENEMNFCDYKGTDERRVRATTNNPDPVHSEDVLDTSLDYVLEYGI